MRAQCVCVVFAYGSDVQLAALSKHSNRLRCTNVLKSFIFLSRASHTDTNRTGMENIFKNKIKMKWSFTVHTADVFACLPLYANQRSPCDSSVM